MDSLVGRACPGNKLSTCHILDFFATISSVKNKNQGGMPIRKKVRSKKKVSGKKSVGCYPKVSSDCPCCGCDCQGKGSVNSLLAVVFGGLMVALTFTLLQTMF